LPLIPTPIQGASVQPPNSISSQQAQAIAAELERQKRQSQTEVSSLQSQLDEQSVSASQLDSMREELELLQLRMADSDRIKARLEEDLAEMKAKGEETLNMQDSVIAGDALIGSTKIQNQVINQTDPEAIVRALIEYERLKGDS
jgi:phage-related minor tail protein